MRPDFSCSLDRFGIPLPQILLHGLGINMFCVLQRQARIKKKNTKELYTESALSIKLDPMHKQRVIAA